MHQVILLSASRHHLSNAYILNDEYTLPNRPFFDIILPTSANNILYNLATILEPSVCFKSSYPVLQDTILATLTYSTMSITFSYDRPSLDNYTKYSTNN